MVHRKSFMETRSVSEGESSCRFSLAYASGYQIHIQKLSCTISLVDQLKTPHRKRNEVNLG